MNNDYEIRGETTAIFINCGGEQRELLIDTADLEKVKSFPNKWKGLWNKCLNDYYCYGQIQRGKEVTSTTIHRFIMEPPNNMVVDHIDHTILNNRRSNLRIVTAAENHQNRNGAYNTSKTGVRGVDWNKQKGKYLARIKADGKRIFIGYFNDLNEAEKAVKEARSKYMPFSQEALETR